MSAACILFLFWSITHLTKKLICPDDKKMKSDYDDYKTKISELEKKLNDYEDKWYSKFSKMETALAKLQSNSSAVTSLLGGS
jgi:flagellar hook-associated protein 2